MRWSGTRDTVTVMPASPPSGFNPRAPREGRATDNAFGRVTAVVEVDGIGSLPAVADFRTACVPGQRVSLRLDGDHVVPVGRADGSA